jgi:hypothetical protein
MTRRTRTTLIAFWVPARFSVVRSEMANGRNVEFGPNGEIAINGRCAEVISRRGHIDPAKMRDLAIAKGATAEPMEVTHHQMDGFKSWQRYDKAKFIVQPAGDAAPIRVTL